MVTSVPSSTKATARVVGDATGYGLRFLGKHGWRMALWFVCLLLPLWGFASLVDEVHKKAVFPFDRPMLNISAPLATPTLDRFFILMSRLGYLWGVVPSTHGTIRVHLARRRFRDGLFFGFAVTGSAVLNIVAKNHYARMRPDLWISLSPETTYSFPSGHAMGFTTLGMAAILLCWPTRGTLAGNDGKRDFRVARRPFAHLFRCSLSFRHSRRVDGRDRMDVGHVYPGRQKSTATAPKRGPGQRYGRRGNGLIEDRLAPFADVRPCRQRVPCSGLVSICHRQRDLGRRDRLCAETPHAASPEFPAEAVLARPHRRWPGHPGRLAGECALLRSSVVLSNCGTLGFRSQDPES